MKWRIGIFQIKNLKNNRILLNTSFDLDRAFNADKFQLKMGLHSNTELQNNWNELGSDAFEFSLVDELKPAESATDAKNKSELKQLLELHKIAIIESGGSLY